MNQRLRRSPPDVVYTPIDVTSAIKEHRRNVRIVMVTGWGVAIDQSEIDKYGIDELLPKPFEIETVLTLVHKLMEEEP